MSGYGDVKSRRMVRLLNWLSKNKKVEVKSGGNHNYKITCIHNGESYPIPSSHRVINKHIVKAFMEWLVINEICTKDEFDSRL
jgi:hypothetical protein